ncbi:MAG: serine/threonine protein kinase [Candidatus Binatia bacterium]
MSQAHKSPWGDAETKFFYELTPERILDAVEASGLRCTGRCMALNSMENRVYQVEVEVDGGADAPSSAFRVVKFYRPGRWSKEQILEEHRFLLDLVAAEVPAVAPQPFDDGSTLAKVGDLEIWCAVFPRVGGRAPEELDDDKLEQLGRLVARLHNTGATRQADARIRLDQQSYGRENLTYLISSGILPPHVSDGYLQTVEQICSICEPWFAQASYQRIHGDCHLGNVLYGGQGFFLVDFDDMVRGPCVQDLWLLVPGSDAEALRQREVVLCGYEQIRAFDRSSLRLIAPLRALRLVHFSAWIGKRWEDPAFQRVFPDFGSERYWGEELATLREQLELMRQSA